MRRIPTRTLAIAVGGVLLALLVVVLAWSWWVPATVRGKVRDAAARRGLVAEVGDVQLSFSNVRLREVRISDPDNEVLTVEIGEVRTHAGLVGLAFEGRGAVRRPHLRQVRIDMNLDAPGLGELIEDARGQSEEPGATPSGGAERTVDVEGLAITLRDRDGIFVQARGGQVELRDERVRINFSPVALAPDGPDGIELRAAQLRLDATEEGWRVGSVRTDSPRVRFQERESEQRSPIWARMRRHSEALSSLSGQHASADASDEPDEGSHADGGNRELLRRLLTAIGPRLAPGAQLETSDLEVALNSENGSRRILRGLRAEIRAVDGGSYQLEGSGQPGGGGRISWELTVHPERLRAVGNVDFERLPFVLLAPVLPRLPWHHPEDTRVSGSLTIEGEGDAPLSLQGRVSVAELALNSSRISSHPVRRIGFSVSGDATWEPNTRRLTLSGGAFRMGEASVEITGEFEWPSDHYRVDVNVRLPSTPCDVAVSAIPGDLLDEVAHFSFLGSLSGRMRLQLDSRDLDATVLTIRVRDRCQFSTAPALADVDRFTRPFRHRVQEPDGTLFEMDTGPTTDNWTRIEDISPFMIQALLGHEDGGFFRHSGFATFAIRRALVRNLREGRFVYGASTITMQLVKNVFLRREKTLARKVQEVLLTWWTERAMDKRSILELYLNVIEYGPGIYGIRNASEHYFGRTPSDLDPAEAAYLATILPNPKGYHSHYEDNRIPARWQRRMSVFVRMLGNRERYDQAAVDYAQARIPALTFHRPADGAPPPRPPVVGRARPMPIEGIAWAGFGNESEGENEEEFDDDDDGFGDGWEGEEEEEEGWPP